MNNSIKYKVFKDKKIVEMTFKEYNKLQKNVKNEYNSLNEVIIGNFNGLKNVNYDDKKNWVSFETQDSKKILIHYMNPKNSGIEDNQAKRLALKSQHLVTGYQIYYVGLMKIGLNNLYILSPIVNKNIERYIASSKAKKGGSYSSYWIGFSDIEKCIMGDIDVTDSDNNLLTVHLDKLVKRLFEHIKQNEVSKEEEILDIFNDILFNEITLEQNVMDFNYDLSVDKVNKNKLIRNTALVEEVLKELQICALCNKESTFPSKKHNGLNYFEVHHFIPYNYKTQKSLLRL
ncbi:hypothetical protein SCLARK_001334 [Spiroplasma clarkii]|uniref:hypothetical protein n=1 Tax=Spiroplasma clarkii TaxID=2139 RepID=UPI000B574393|nr:hypothetical protein [Spiroplasma clarkii]ARU91867.1 hypothetical protein SCLARK_001334 [Spiroplasma clarkii]